MITFLICIVVSFSYALLLTKHIRKHYLFHYSLAVILSLLQFSLLLSKEAISNQIVLELSKAFTSGLVGTSLFIVVMFTGAFDVKDPFSKKLRSVRKELSIIASYLLMFHIIYYTVINLINFSSLSLMMLLVTISGILAAIVMLPLFITSFIKVRKKFTGKQWKKIQKWSYLFYFLVYIHMLVANISPEGVDAEKVSLYTVVFFIYTFARIRIHILNQKRKSIKLKQVA